MALQVTYRYKVQKPEFEHRKIEGSKTLKNHPTKVPVVVGKVNKSSLPELENFKFLFPASSKVNDIIEWINQKLGRPSYAPLFLYVDDEVVVSRDSKLSRIYQEYRENDYFLYIAYYEIMIYDKKS